jgi:hypothetical protein
MGFRFHLKPCHVANVGVAEGMRHDEGPKARRTRKGAVIVLHSRREGQSPLALRPKGRLWTGCRVAAPHRAFPDVHRKSATNYRIESIIYL